jgi:hypothetical protein
MELNETVYLGKKLLEFTAGFCLKQVVAATNVLLVDKDVRHSALTGLSGKVFLNSIAILDLIELNDKKLGQSLKSLLCATAVS